MCCIKYSPCAESAYWTFDSTTNSMNGSDCIGDYIEAVGEPHVYLCYGKNSIQVTKSDTILGLKNTCDFLHASGAADRICGSIFANAQAGTIAVTSVCGRVLPTTLLKTIVL